MEKYTTTDKSAWGYLAQVGGEACAGCAPLYVGGGDITSTLAVASLALVPPKKRGSYLRPILKTLFGLLPPKLLRKVSLRDARCRGRVCPVN